MFINSGGIQPPKKKCVTKEQLEKIAKKAGYSSFEEAPVEAQRSIRQAVEEGRQLRFYI